MVAALALVLALGPQGPALGGDESLAPAPPSPRSPVPILLERFWRLTPADPGGLAADLDVPTLPDPGEPLQVTSRLRERDLEAGSPRLAGSALHLTAEGRGDWLGGRWTEEVEMLGFATDTAESLSLGPEPWPRLVRSQLKGAWGPLESGIRLDSVSRGLGKLAPAGTTQDRERLERWIAVALGPVRLKGLSADSRNNADDDPRRGYTEESEAGMAVELFLPAGSLVSLAATRGRTTSAAARRGAGEAEHRGASRFDRMSLTVFGAAGEAGGVTLTSTVTWVAPEDLVDDQGPRESLVTAHDVSGTYRLGSRVTVVPAFGVSERDPGGDQPEDRTLTGSLSVVVAPLSRVLDLTLYGGYSRSSTGDRSFDARSLDATASVVWHLRRSPPRTTLTFEVGHSRWEDPGPAGSRGDATSGLVLLKVALF